MFGVFVDVKYIYGSQSHHEMYITGLGGCLLFQELDFQGFVCSLYYSLALEIVGNSHMMGNFPVHAEGFELRASEGRAIISFYLLRNAHDGKGGEHMVNEPF